jgi:hypothetical protein
VFIAHAKAALSVVYGLKPLLRQRGLMAEIETAERGLRYLQASDLVVTLWSQVSIFSTWLTGVERRMLEAWARQQPAPVKPDHNPRHIGLRDLQAIDAVFDRQREVVHWSEALRLARDAMNRPPAQRPSRRPPHRLDPQDRRPHRRWLDGRGLEGDQGGAWCGGDMLEAVLRE